MSTMVVLPCVSKQGAICHSTGPEPAGGRVSGSGTGEPQTVIAAWAGAPGCLGLRQGHSAPRQQESEKRQKSSHLDRLFY